MGSVKVKVFVSLKETVLDPQGATVQKSLKALGYDNVEDARVGKVFVLTLKSGNNGLEEQIQEMSDRLLANPVIEDFTYEVDR
ncbi:MAG: phosphoribosylformylglycinamidine synthase subunit PurS [Terriglobia bacterium]